MVTNPNNQVSYDSNSQVSVDKLLKRIKDLPSLPELINKIVSLLGQSNSTASEIAKLISFDPGLTSKVLRMVNSSAYGFQRQISSVQHAIMILGFGQVRGLVLGASILKLFEKSKAQGLDLNEQWKHCMQTAAVSRYLAEKYRIPYAEDAFSAGLLHDIGKIVLSVYATQIYSPLALKAQADRIQPHGAGFYNLERTVLGTNHAEIGAEVALKWKLPTSFIEVIRYHHAPHNAHDAPELVYTIALANSFCWLDITGTQELDLELVPKNVWTYFYECINHNKDQDPMEVLASLYQEVRENVGQLEDLTF